jgi:hypothetical protein
MHTFTARLLVLACTLVALAANVFVGEGQLWLEYGVIAVATIGALVATAYVPQDRLLFGVMFATLAFGAVSRYERLTNGITARHVAAAVVAAAVLTAFVTLAPRVIPSGSRRHA